MGKLKQKINWGLLPYYSKPIRCATVFLFSLIFLMDKLFRFHNNYSFFYSFIMVLAGLCLLDVKLQLLASFLVSVTASLLSPFAFTPFLVVIPWITNFFICFIITSSIKVNIREQKNQVCMIETLISAIESKDEYTAAHSIKVAKYAATIAKRLHYPESECKIIYIGGLLHDIGKIGIGDKVLNKASALTSEEYDTIRRHPEIGYTMLQHMDFYEKDKILEMVLYHHERFDGQGYPEKIKAGTLSQRVAIISLADAYDAMTSKRTYRDKHDNSYAIKEIEKNSGTQFDPVVARAFIDYLKSHPNDSPVLPDRNLIGNLQLVK